MQAISVDLPWAEAGEAAVAVVDATGNATWSLCPYPEGLMETLRQYSDSLVLLDIPIYGLDRLRGGHFRPVDKALQSVGIPLRPSTSAHRLGAELADRIVAETGIPPHSVREIYPYAVYKWLAYLCARGALGHLAGCKFETLLDGGFPRFFPLPYKHASPRGSRRQGMEALYALLSDPDLGLRFQTPLPAPDGGEYSLKRLSDIYDAALGAVLGLHLLRADQWAVVMGDQRYGDLALLADTWLAGRIETFLSNAAEAR